MSALEVFRFERHDIRAVMIDGEPWFVLADICTPLGLEQVSRVKSRLDDALTRSNPIPDRSGTSRMMTVVSEPGMYEVILRSDKPEARPLMQFVTHEVLPQIRKTGSYSPAPALSEDEIVHQALAITARRVEVLTAQVAELEPRAEAWDELASATGDYAVKDAAGILARAGVKTGQNRLFTQLRDLGWIHRAHDGGWRAYASAVNAGYLTEKPQSHHHPRTGELVLDAPQVRVTIRGLDRLRVRLGALALSTL